MIIYDAGRIIRDRISMQEILDFYEYKPKRGFMCCPFHNEKEPSLKIYPNSWHCFGCKRGGSVIDFVMEQEGCSFSTAIQAIDGTFNLGLLNTKDPADNIRSVFTRLLNAIADNMLEELRQTETIIEYQIRLKFLQVQKIEDKAKPERTAREWDDLNQLLYEMEYLEYKKQCCDELHTEITEWRRNCHRRLHPSPDRRD